MDNETSLMKFQDEDGNVYLFELLDTVEFEGGEYAVMLPEEGSELDNGMVHIFEVAEELDSDTDTYLGIDDQRVIDEVYRLFLEAHGDEFNLTD
ncbi:MAG: DUF1292 domain-containing protein [Clostridia bacterium]|nr:DUF1292 domain-containing protein [Clostridia bacterium]